MGVLCVAKKFFYQVWKFFWRNLKNQGLSNKGKKKLLSFIFFYPTTTKTLKYKLQKMTSTRWDSKSRPTQLPKHPETLTAMHVADLERKRRSTRLLTSAGNSVVKSTSTHSTHSNSAAMTKGSARTLKKDSEQLQTYYLPSWRPAAVTPLHAIHVLPSFLSRDLCDTMIYEAENSTFTTKRHKHFPTVDVPLRHMEESYRQFYSMLHSKVYPLARRLYKLKGAKFNIVDLFVVKYTTRGQNELKEHRDGSIISFNILLNPSKEFRGGGTKFGGVNLTVRNEQGGMLLHCGKVKHSGVKITGRGSVRFILVGFLNVQSESLVTEASRLSLRSLTSDDEYLRGLYVDQEKAAAPKVVAPLQRVAPPQRVAPQRVAPTAKTSAYRATHHSRASLSKPASATSRGGSFPSSSRKALGASSSTTSKPQHVAPSRTCTPVSSGGLLSCFRSQRKNFPQTLPRHG